MNEADLSVLAEEKNPWWRHPEHRVARAYPYRRDAQRQIVTRLLAGEDRRALVLMGPRQVGKTTILLQAVDDLLDAGWPPANLVYFDFSDDRLANPPSPREVARLEPPGFSAQHPRVLLLDEVGSSERWDRWLKQAVDQGAGRIVATDSAATLVRQAGRESGVGRWDELWLEGLLLGEFLSLASGGKEPDEALRLDPSHVARYLELGGFPEQAALPGGGRGLRTEETLRRLREGVVERTILRDLSREVRDPRPARSLFVYLMQESGGIWNARARASDLGVDPRSVGQWLQLLEDTLLVVALPRYAQKPAARLRSDPKLFAADHGLIRAFSAAAVADPAVEGRVYEAVVFRHLRELARSRGGDLTYFRDRQGLEADFVLTAPGERGASSTVVEVTASRTIKGEKVQRLREVAGRLAARRTLLVYGATVHDDVGDLATIPLVRFLLDPKGAVG